MTLARSPSKGTSGSVARALGSVSSALALVVLVPALAFGGAVPAAAFAKRAGAGHQFRRVSRGARPGDGVNLNNGFRLVGHCDSTLTRALFVEDSGVRLKMASEYVLDGAAITSLEGFYEQVSSAIIPGVGWGRNLDAFNDILHGGFGTPDGGFTIRWMNSDLSRAHLGHAETVWQLEQRLDCCHPSNRATLQHDLEQARAARGPTVFDWVVEIIRLHGPGGADSGDNVKLLLS